jgi:endonuclease/exonuclease/phosphatase family metal-dependent hydrolase
MKKRFMFLIKLLLISAVAFGAYVVLSILYAWITDYRPKPETDAEILKTDNEISNINKDTLVFYDWNIGYCGLGAESDFFYDGGKMVRSTRDLVNKNYAGVKETILKWKQDADFILLQEVDVDSRRSWGQNQLQGIKEMLDFNAVFGKNYQVRYVPIPITNPMGGVLGGIATFFPYKLEKTPIRYQFPSNFSFPKGLFFLDRCFVKHTFKLKNGKNLIVINTHNSAYDGGTLKKQEMEYFKKYLVDEYNAGNYVIVGGDWNQIPPGYTPKDKNSGYEEMEIPNSYLPKNWTWAFDGKTPTNRKVDKPYESNKTYTTVIDFYLLSPNVSLINVQGIDVDFSYSDHQPVRMVCSLQ